MLADLNPTQAKGLANFFFDIAKGLALGGIGLSLKGPASLRITFLSVSLFLTYEFIRAALFILKDIK